MANENAEKFLRTESEVEQDREKLLQLLREGSPSQKATEKD